MAPTRRPNPGSANAVSKTWPSDGAESMARRCAPADSSDEREALSLDRSPLERVVSPGGTQPRHLVRVVDSGGQEPGSEPEGPEDVEEPESGGPVGESPDGGGTVTPAVGNVSPGTSVCAHAGDANARRRAANAKARAWTRIASACKSGHPNGSVGLAG